MNNCRRYTLCVNTPKNALSHRWQSVRFHAHRTQFTCFNFPFDFFRRMTHSTKSRLYVFSTVGLGHGHATMRTRRDFSRNARIVVRVLSACRRISFERTKKKTYQKQNNNKKLIGSHSDRDDFFLSLSSFSSLCCDPLGVIRPACVCDRLLIKLNIQAYTFLDNSVEMSICFDSIPLFKRRARTQREKCDSSRFPATAAVAFAKAKKLH